MFDDIIQELKELRQLLEKTNHRIDEGTELLKDAQVKCTEISKLLAPVNTGGSYYVPKTTGGGHMFVPSDSYYVPKTTGGNPWRIN